MKGRGGGGEAAGCADALHASSAEAHASAHSARPLMCECPSSTSPSASANPALCLRTLSHHFPCVCLGTLRTRCSPSNSEYYSMRCFSTLQVARRVEAPASSVWSGVHVKPTPLFGWSAVSPLCTHRRHASGAASAQAAAKVNHYRSLGVDTDATPQEVKAAYRQLALTYHPDVAVEAHRSQAEVLFRRVSEAYEVLSDPVRRRAHDGELGVQTRRKQQPQPASTSPAKTGASTAAQAAHSPWSSSRTAARRRQQSASATARAAGPQGAPSSRYRKPFVRGDANRVFADAFDGKTMDEILFDVQRRRRQERRQCAEADGARPRSAPSSGAVDSAWASSGSVALDRDARLRHAMETAAESFAQRAQQQYGHGILRHIRASASPLPEGPAPAPKAYMPFRPFVNTAVPAGVQTPPEPELGPVLRSEDATAEGDDTGSHVDERVGVPRHFHTHAFPDGSPQSRMASLNKATRHIQGMPHNMGQLYSYQRPY